MSANPIQEAIENLAVQGIFLRSTTISQRDDFDIRLTDKDLLVQNRAGASNFSDIEIVDEKTGETQRLFKIIFKCAIRLADPDLIQGEEMETGLVVEINATFVAEYLIKPEATISQEAKQAFAKTNVGYHVWPYWREYVQSTCARVGLPLIAVPMYTVPKANQKQASPAKRERPVKSIRTNDPH